MFALHYTAHGSLISGSGIDEEISVIGSGIDENTV